MKINIFIPYLVGLSIMCFAQEEERTIKSEKYIDALQNCQGESYSKFMAIDDKEFNHIVRLAYEAIEIASTEILRKTKDDIPLRNAQGDFFRVIKERYSYILKNLIRIPVFVKAKILSSEEVNKGGFRQINLKLKQEYIIKGKETFLLQPEFEVYYREYEYVTESNDYKIGKSYLFPLWDRGEPENKIFSIATWLSGDGSRFLVENGVLHDENNNFKMGTEVNWDDFVKSINEMIFKIVNEKELDVYKMPR